MKRKILSIFVIPLILISACGQALSVSPTSEMPVGTSVVNSVATPAQGTVSTPVISAATPDAVNYTGVFLEALEKNEDSCLPDQTSQCIGVYVYDLNLNQELVSINADVPFQFASAFKGPVLVYFLENCRKYWDVNSAAWSDYFATSNPPYSDPWFASDEYRQILHTYLSEIGNWGTIENFASQYRNTINDQAGFIDQRYFILEQAYNMIVQSNNVAAGNVLKFVYENCLPGPSAAIEQQCGGSNAITEFNLWFNNFSGIVYAADEPRRGLYSWDTITATGSSGQVQEVILPTYGLFDTCANQTAFLLCSNNLSTTNVWTARDFFQFYNTLFRLSDLNVKSAAIGILKIDEPGASRGYLKNMMGNMGTTSMSKDGYFGFIIADAGIVAYQGHYYIIATLSYDAADSIVKLYGQYNLDGTLVEPDTGLLQKMIEGTLVSP